MSTIARGAGAAAAARLLVLMLLVTLSAALGSAPWTRDGAAPASGASQMVTLFPGDSYDFDTGTRGSFTGGHLYYVNDGQPMFWANNLNQAGVADLGPAGSRSLGEVQPPAAGYTRFGVNAIPDHFYAALPRAGPASSHVVFRVVSLGALSVTLEYRVLKAAFAFVPMIASDSASPARAVTGFEVLETLCEPPASGTGCVGEFPSLALRFLVRVTYNNDGSVAGSGISATILWVYGTCLIDVSGGAIAEVGTDLHKVVESSATLTTVAGCSAPTQTDRIYAFRVCLGEGSGGLPADSCRDFPFEMDVTFVRP